MNKSPNDKLINELVRRILSCEQPIQIILFGSAGRGSMGPNSDLDVLVIMPEGTHRRHTAMNIYRHLSGFPFATDIIVATTSDIEKHIKNPSFIYQQALEEGRELYHAAA